MKSWLRRKGFDKYHLWCLPGWRGGGEGLELERFLSLFLSHFFNLMQIILREDGDDQNKRDAFDDDFWNPNHKIHQQLLSFWKKIPVLLPLSSLYFLSFLLPPALETLSSFSCSLLALTNTNFTISQFCLPAPPPPCPPCEPPRPHHHKYQVTNWTAH